MSWPRTHFLDTPCFRLALFLHLARRHKTAARHAHITGCLAVLCLTPALTARRRLSNGLHALRAHAAAHSSHRAGLGRPRPTWMRSRRGRQIGHAHLHGAFESPLSYQCGASGATPLKGARTMLSSLCAPQGTRLPLG